MDRLKHFNRWLPNGWWPWVGAPAVVVVVVLLIVQSPAALVVALLVPASAWVGFTRHEARTAEWKRA